MSKLPSGLLEFLEEKTGFDKRTISRRINDKKRELGFIYSRRIAGFVFAIDNDIDVTSFMNKQDKEKVKEALGSGTRIVHVERKNTEKAPSIKVIKFPNLPDVEAPNLKNNIIREAKEMSEVYYYLYLFENSLRQFIIDVLFSAYGNSWWRSNVSSSIQSKAKKRQLQDNNNRWHCSRGAHPLFYIDIDDLRKIIIQNQSLFEEKLPDNPIEWLTQRINEIELSRNIVAHHNCLEEDDIKQVKLYFRQWVKQIVT